MRSVGDMLRGAVGLHQRGQLADAEKLYNKVLAIDSRQFDALHLLGLLKHQRGDSDQAIRLMAAALDVNPRSPPALLNYAGMLFMMRRYADALTCYDRVLKLEPQLPDAHYNRGNALMGLGRPGEALAAYDRALSLNPSNPLAHYNRGNALVALNRVEEALAAFEQTLKLSPQSLEALMNRGKALSLLGRNEEALAIFDDMLTKQPDDPVVLTNRGSALAALGRNEEALVCFDRALAVNPLDAPALNSRASALIELNRFEEALQSCDQLLAAQPLDRDALVSRGTALLRLHRLEEALAAFERALLIDPDEALAINGRGLALHGLGRYAEALECVDKALAITPDDVGLKINRGAALVGLNRMEEALVCYDEVLKTKPQDVGTINNRGNALRDLNRYQEALACFDQALAINPEHAESHWNSALARLANGDLVGGWKEYEWRWKTADFPSKQRIFPQPRWQGEYVNGRLLAWGEQGLGDQIIYASMIPDLASHADSVLIEVGARMVPLFARSFPAMTVIARGEAEQHHFDAHSAFASLGQYLRPNFESFPYRENGYLVADAERAAALRRRVSPNGEKVIGLSWVSKNPTLSERKTAQLRDFESILRLPGCRFIDLQYGDTAAEREALHKETGIVVERLEDIDNTNDIDGLAALITACDLVATVSNTTAHLAGALGKPTVVFVPFGRARIWYWFKEGTACPWYPRLRLKRAVAGQSWEQLVSAAADEIAELVAAAHRSP